MPPSPVVILCTLTGAPMPAPTDPILSAHLARRDAHARARLSQVDPAHYLDVVLRDRADRYAAHVASMTLTPDMVQWALAMTRSYGPYVKAHHYIADWITALLILRYGEEPDATLSSDPNFRGWPTAFTDADRKRASELLTGAKWTAALTVLAVEAAL